MDFYEVIAKTFGSRAKQDYTIQPEFTYLTNDLICKGGDLYAYWDNYIWRTSKLEMIQQIDKDVLDFASKFKSEHVDRDVSVKLMSTHSTQVMESFNKYAKNMPESTVEFNTRILFSNETPTREDYSTTQLSYTPTTGETPAFDKMFNLLYSEPELEKILWFIGATLTNSMSKIQKFLFLYGGKGSGKGTILKVFKLLFEGYYAGIDLHKLTGNSEFATSGVRETQLLIDDDSDLSSIKDDTNLLKLTSHEPILVNNKYQSTYSVTFKGLLVAASNQRFKVRNVDSGITRRAIVAEPTDMTHDYETYMTLMEQIEFELPHIAQRAIDVFTKRGPGYYEEYVPYEMMESTDLFFSFMREHARALGDRTTLKSAAELYRMYLTDFEYDTSGYKKRVKNELKRYYTTFVDQKKIDGENVKNIYEGLKWEMLFPGEKIPKLEDVSKESLLAYFDLKEQPSTFDRVASQYPAQYTTDEGLPKSKWDDVDTTLSEINTEELHFVRVPIRHIIIDFDLKNETGEKDLILNLKEAKKFPETYTELSKSGQGVHLHYIYEGDVEKLASDYAPDIEIKVYKGKSSLRRKRSLCNTKEITHISTGLPEKEEALDVYKDIEVIHWNENKMRTAVKGNLAKKYHTSTRPSIDFIVKIFTDAEQAGVKYDLRDLRQDVLSFASSSTNQAAYCIKAISKIKFSTLDEVDANEIQVSAGKRFYKKEELYFYDVEVFSNLFIVSFKQYGKDKPVTTWINPTKEQIASFVDRPLVGFNNRRYDNHIIYSALLGENNLSLYRQSQRIINDKNAGSGMYGGAYELSYTDIYDYCNAGSKKSLKKWEVELGIKHDEFELAWDQPVPEDMWQRAAEYCENDVRATEAVFDATQSDYNARRILSTLSGLSMNSTTNQHTTAIIFENKNRTETMKELVYTDLSTEFPGYSYSFGKSQYRDEDPGEGGYVYAEPGVYENVALLDIASMHPTTAIELNMFGRYTNNFKGLMDGRLACKHDDMDKLKSMFDGRLSDILVEDDITLKDISNGLKTAINSVYGLTSASFENPFRHPQNNDNIVAKRGALFMIELKHAVQERGYQVAHIKTDSIKIPNADSTIIDFVSEMGAKYGYTFEHEDTYKKFALVNKSTYICQDMDDQWHATGAQFQDQYVFKTLFTKEAIQPEDFFFTKEVKNAAIFLGDKFIGRLAEIYASQSGDEIFRVVEDKSGSISGTKGFKWRLSKDWIGREDVDMIYYKELVEKAVTSIKKVGDIHLLIPDYLVDDEPNVPIIIDGIEVNPSDLPF